MSKQFRFLLKLDCEFDLRLTRNENVIYVIWATFGDTNKISSYSIYDEINSVKRSSHFEFLLQFATVFDSRIM